MGHDNLFHFTRARAQPAELSGPGAMVADGPNLAGSLFCPSFSLRSRARRKGSRSERLDQMARGTDAERGTEPHSLAHVESEVEFSGDGDILYTCDIAVAEGVVCRRTTQSVSASGISLPTLRSMPSAVKSASI